MGKILFVNACVRPESRTMILAKHVLGKLNGEIEEVNLEKEHIQPMNLQLLQEREDALKAENPDVPILKYAKQFIEADTIVVAAPYWDLSFPAMVKAYFEAVTVCGISFVYTPEGYPLGLCKAKRLIYVMTAGGPVMEPDWGFGYVQALAENFYGIRETICFKAENLDIIGADVTAILEKTKAQIDAYKFE